MAFRPSRENRSYLGLMKFKLNLKNKMQLKNSILIIKKKKCLITSRMQKSKATKISNLERTSMSIETCQLKKSRAKNESRENKLHTKRKMLEAKIVQFRSQLCRCQDL
jgi:hypothetical protein